MSFYGRTEPICGIYQARLKKDGRVYIGQSVDCEDRRKAHKSSSKTEDTYFYRAIRKYGWENFEWSIIEECSREDLDTREMFWIKKKRSNKEGFGFNSTEGGNGNKGYSLSAEAKEKLSRLRLGTHLSEETKQKISAAEKGRVLSEESKRALSLKRQGKNNPFYGKHHSEETIRRIQQTLKGRSSPMKGKVFSEETKQKISKRYSGEGNPSYGTKCYNNGQVCIRLKIGDPVPHGFELGMLKRRK